MGRSYRIERLAFCLPFLIPLCAFWILPLAGSAGISFTDWDYISPDIHFVGLENFVDILTHPDFLKALANTMVFGLGTIIPSIILGLGFALILQRNGPLEKLYQTLFFLPYITPTVAVSLVWSWIYDPERGFANHVLAILGIAPSRWLQSSDTALVGVMIFTIWKSVGWALIFYLGALSRIPKTLYEAASLDGAGQVQKFFNVTLPALSPTTFFLFLVNLISSIQVYDQIQIMTQGGPGGATTTLMYLYYQKAFQKFQMGPASVVALVTLAIALALSALSARISDRHVHYF